MPAFDAPALIASRNKFAADIELRAQQAGRIADARTPGTGYTEIANGMAALAHGLYNDIENARDQLFVDSMSDETLLKRAAEKGILRIDPFFAQGSINVSGNDEAGNYEKQVYAKKTTRKKRYIEVIKQDHKYCQRSHSFQRRNKR